MDMRKGQYSKRGLIFKRFRIIVAFCLVVLGGCTLINRAASARVMTVVPPIEKMTVQFISALDNGMPVLEDYVSLMVQLKRGRSKGVDSRQQEWERLSPDEKAQYQKRYQQLKKMSPEERKKYEKMHQQWQKLSPEERRQIRNKLQRSQELSPQELNTLKRRFNE